MRLKEDGLVPAPEGKIVISIFAGITPSQLEFYIDATPFAGGSMLTSIIRAMPNTYAVHNASTPY